MFKFVLCLAVLAVSLSHVRTQLTDESERAHLEHLDVFIDECGKELNLDAKEIKKVISTTQKIDGIDKCFFGCVLKKEGTMTEDGKIDIGVGLAALKGVIKNADDYKIIEAASKACLSVNDEKVSDGDKGCERAFNFVTCIETEKRKH